MFNYEVATWEPWEGRRDNCGIKVKSLRGLATVEIQGDELLVLHREKNMLRGRRIPMGEPGVLTGGSIVTYLSIMDDEVFLCGSSHLEVDTPMGFPCDERMATLLSILHGEGMKTRYSCQGEQCVDEETCEGECFDSINLAYIMFEDPEHAELLLSLVEEEEYYGYVDGQGDRVVRFESAFLDLFVPSGFPPRMYPQGMKLYSKDGRIFAEDILPE